MIVVGLLLASAVGAEIPVFGRVESADGGWPSGSHGVTIRLYGDAAGVDLRHSEGAVIAFDDGAFGALFSVPDAVFVSPDPLWLTIQVGDDPESTSAPVGVVPRAVWASAAGDAASIGGVPASAVHHSGRPIVWDELDEGTAPEWVTAPQATSGVDLVGATISLDAGEAATLLSGDFRAAAWVPTWADVQSKPGWAQAAPAATTGLMVSGHTFSLVASEVAGLVGSYFRAASWVPSWSQVTGKPSGIDGSGTFTVQNLSVTGGVSGDGSALTNVPLPRLQWSSCRYTACADAPEVLNCSTNEVMVGVALPEFGGDQAVGSCVNEDDFYIRCCTLSIIR
jgi:hypothetical protein